MSRTKPTIIFFHGLNTYGDDLLHLGPVTLGRMDRHLVPEFEKRGVRFISINGIGDGTPEAQADHAMKQIAQIAFDEGPVHLLGNSLGGLVARVVATKMAATKAKVASIISWGSPHLGAGAADLAMNFPGKYPQVTEALAKIGYVVGKNSDVYRHYSSAGLVDFNTRYPQQKSTPEHSFVCAVPLKDVSPYFWPFFAPLHGLGPIEFAMHVAGKQQKVPDSDGFISVASQSRGETHGPYYLDHFVQAGFVSMMPLPAQRRRARHEFEKLCSDIVSLVYKQ